MDLENVFDKESFMDTLYTLHTKGKFTNHWLWYKLTNNTKISNLTPVGKTDRGLVNNSQGSFGAAISSSLNIGRTVNDLTLGECKTKIEPMPLNFHSLQENIARMSNVLPHV